MQRYEMLYFSKLLGGNRWPGRRDTANKPALPRRCRYPSWMTCFQTGVANANFQLQQSRRWFVSALARANHRRGYSVRLEAGRGTSAWDVVLLLSSGRMHATLLRRVLRVDELLDLFSPPQNYEFCFRDLSLFHFFHQLKRVCFFKNTLKKCSSHSEIKAKRSLSPYTNVITWLQILP